MHYVVEYPGLYDMTRKLAFATEIYIMYEGDLISVLSEACWKKFYYHVIYVNFLH